MAPDTKKTAKSDQTADEATEEQATAQAADETDETDETDSDTEQVPEGTVQEVTDWVGEDTDRAQQALDSENESDSPRSTLVAALEKITATVDSDAAADQDDEAPDGSTGDGSKSSSSSKG